VKVKDEAGFVALVTDTRLAPTLAARMASPATRLLSYPSVEQLVDEQPLGGLRVLVIWTKGVPRGRVLPMLARLNLELPWVQKIALLQTPPPLVLAEYLTACGVEVIWSGSVEERLEQVQVLMNRNDERARWLGAA